MTGWAARRFDPEGKHPTNADDDEMPVPPADSELPVPVGAGPWRGSVPFRVVPRARHGLLPMPADA